MTGLEFLTIIIFALAIGLVIAGIFTAWFGVNKSKVHGALMVVFGLVIGAVWLLLCGIGGIMDPVIDVDVSSVLLNALVNFIAVIIGGIIAVAIFLFAVLKS